MKKVAVMLADGFEEIEALATVDILRRAGIECNIIGIDKLELNGAHEIKVKADEIINENLKE